MKVVRDDRGIATDPSTCGGPMRMQVVDLASKPVVSTLQLNDIVTGTVVLNRSEKRPDSPWTGRWS